MSVWDTAVESIFGSRWLRSPKLTGDSCRTSRDSCSHGTAMLPCQQAPLSKVKGGWSTIVEMGEGYSHARGGVGGGDKKNNFEKSNIFRIAGTCGATGEKSLKRKKKDRSGGIDTCN